MRMKSRSENGHYFKPYEIKEMLEAVAENYDFVRTKKDYFLNLPCSFDIETSSFYDKNSEKTAIMYCWMLGINGAVCFGRTWDEFFEVVEVVSKFFGLSERRRLILYVHNLSYEFQFLKDRFKWQKVFAIDARKPVYAIAENGIEFRCSYLLSNSNLELVGKNLQKYKCQKMVGDLDYDLIRHSKTSLTKKEMGYCINDVLVVMSYIQEEIENNGDISKIPLTNTGRVRRFVKNNCFDKTNDRFHALHYSQMIKSMPLDVQEFKMLRRAFQGGFTHASAMRVFDINKNVTSFDFSSSYPAVMLSEKFPMSESEIIDDVSEEEFRNSIKYYCCLIDIEFFNIKAKYNFERYIQIYKCVVRENAVVDNGRLHSATKIAITITEQDFKIIDQMYTFDEYRVIHFRRYLRDFLPSEILQSTLDLYKAKTELKGVDGAEQAYMLKKGMLNSIYGMMVTSIIRPEITYNFGRWQIFEKDLENEIEKYNKGRGRFLHYPWGVWVSAYARSNLFSGILECKNDYVYSDTDSIKIVNAENHLEYINFYNEHVTKKIKKCCDARNLNFEDTRPKTIKNVEKPLGVWEFDGFYTRFKTLGAKRYLCELEDGSFSLTVSGLNKKNALSYLIEKYDDPFNAFNDELFIPGDATGCKTHTYIDEARSGDVVDYQGTIAHYNELSSIHLEASDYKIDEFNEFIDFVFKIRR